MKSRLKEFVLPAHYPKKPFDFAGVSVCAILPAYKPGELTGKLVRDLVRWNPSLTLYVVDDCTPPGFGESARIFEEIAAVSPRVTVLRTPVNRLKAGALNYAIERVLAGVGGPVPDVILTLDDDVVIEPTTVQNLVTELMSYEHLGAVCSQCRVFNKNKNLLTRLQGLEYVAFNAIRLADEGFFKGPLVMHGMLTAFKTAALWQAGKFFEGHLIEDYEMTTRLKAQGWSVKSAVNAPAWTVVPETLRAYWRQRTRWSYGGVTVVVRASDPMAVLQDLIGHGLFFVTLLMLGLLFVARGDGHIAPVVAQAIIVLAFLQLVVWYVFQLWLMRLYKEKDWLDWVIRVSLVPEFVYSYCMTLALIGSYLFFAFNAVARALIATGGRAAQRIAGLGTQAFGACGYTENWGTRIH